MNLELTLKVLEKFRKVVFEDLYAGSAESDWIPPEEWAVLAETSKTAVDADTLQEWLRQPVFTDEEDGTVYHRGSLLVYAVLDELAYSDEDKRDPDLLEWLKIDVPEAYKDLMEDNYLLKYEKI
jgi:hypothetical protein